ncbi:peptidoglycan-binding domain-containing protein [Spirillospora sp. CA-253888]
MHVKRLAIAGLTAGMVVGGTALAPAASADPTPSDQHYGSWPVLKRGHKNEEVRALQWFLNCTGHRLDTPSVFGPKTHVAVRTFQARHVAPADGIVGARTWLTLLSRDLPAGHTQRNDCVKALQVLLNKWRYNDDLPITGYHGDRTRKKLLRFQREHGLPAHGDADTPTYHKLLATPAGK